MAKKEQNKEIKTSPAVPCSGKVSFPFNTIFLISNAIFLVIAGFWFLTVITLHYNSDECNRFATSPGILISFSLIFMGLTGFYAAYLKSDCLFRIHFFIFFLWMLVTISKGIFAFFLNKETTPRLFPGSKIQEFRIEDYSGWVRRLVIKEDEWYRTKRCHFKTNVCNTLNQNMTASEFYQMDLSLIQSGCCKPPLSCGLSYQKPTIWKVSRYYNNSEEDCRKWNNSPDTLCFDCNSCKAVTIADLQKYTFSFKLNSIHTTNSLFVGTSGWLAWLRILRETHK